MGGAGLRLLLARYRGRQLGPVLVFIVLSAGCKNEESCSDGYDCSDPPSFLVDYEANTLGNSSEYVYLYIEFDGECMMHVGREGSPNDDLACGNNCEEGPTNSLCMTGWLDDEQMDAVYAVLQPDLAEAYDLDDLLSPHVEQPRDRSIQYQPIEEGAEGHSFGFNSEGPLQPETVVLIDTFDEIALDLWARPEYCTDEYRALAEDGEWVFAIKE